MRRKCSCRSRATTLQEGVLPSKWKLRNTNGVKKQAVILAAFHEKDSEFAKDAIQVMVAGRKSDVLVIQDEEAPNTSYQNGTAAPTEPSSNTAVLRKQSRI